MPEPTGKPGDGGAGDEGGAAAGDKTPEAPKPITFSSQEELDRIIQDRVKRATPADYETLKEKAAKHDEAEAAKKSEAERAKDAQTKAETAAAERTALADTRLKRAAIIEEAVAQGADTDLVLALLAGSNKITVGEDGEVAGAKAAVKKLLEDKPILKGKAPSTSGGEFGGNDEGTIDERISAAERAGKHLEARDLKIQKGLGAK